MTAATRHYLDFERPIADLEAKIEELSRLSDTAGPGAFDQELAALKHRVEDLRREAYARLDPWQKTQVARHPERPHFVDYVSGLIDEFVELRGDRKFADDQAVVGGLGRFRGMPVVVMRAADFGKTGYETPEELEADLALKARVEAIRLQIGPRMNLGDVTKKTVPKMCLVAPPRAGGIICTRNFIPHRVHEAIGVLGAVSVATACVTPGSVAAEVAGIADVEAVKELEVEHPTGFFTVAMDVTLEDGAIHVRRSALLRTARKLMEGKVFVPAHLWSGR